MEKTKAFQISKMEIWEAYKRVKANRGSAGVDKQTIEQFKANLKNNLYKLWNRMSSGSYFPPPVKRVSIDKDDGGTRPLGIPTVTDRIAQTVVKRYLEPELEKHFHPDSYGYRPNKSAIEAVGVARERCWRYKWVLDLDIRAFFDNVDHELLMRALRKHTDCKWILLYVERWLKAPVIEQDGTLQERTMGTPQGSVISPVLANLFLHYALDKWMERLGIPFERYADDIICHCRSEAQAKLLLNKIKSRLTQCGLEVHPEKTKIIYCKSSNRAGDHEHVSFDFLGYTFRPRAAKNKSGELFLAFSPAVSGKSKKKMRKKLKEWKLYRKTSTELRELAKEINPAVNGWIQYYSHYSKSEMRGTYDYIDRTLVKWCKRKYKRLRSSKKAWKWLAETKKADPELFTYWKVYPY